MLPLALPPSASLPPARFNPCTTTLLALQSPLDSKATSHLPDLCDLPCVIREKREERERERDRDGRGREATENVKAEGAQKRVL